MPVLALRLTAEWKRNDIRLDTIEEMMPHFHMPQLDPSSRQCPQQCVRTAGNIPNAWCRIMPQIGLEFVWNSPQAINPIPIARSDWQWECFLYVYRRHADEVYRPSLASQHNYTNYQHIIPISVYRELYNVFIKIW